MGLLVGLIGVYLLMNYRQSSLLFSYTYIILPAVTLASAVFLVVAGFIGSCLSVKDSTCLQGLVRFGVWLSVCEPVFGLIITKCFLLQFVYLLVLVFCLESTASALAYFHFTKVRKLQTNLCAIDQFVIWWYCKHWHDIFCVLPSLKLDSELAHLSGFFQKYTGSCHDLVSQAVDATQEKVCIGYNT